MLVGEMIEKLKAFDPLLRAVTPGFDDVEEVALVNAISHDDRKDNAGHSGPHDAIQDHYTGDRAKIEKAVLINF